MQTINLYDANNYVRRQFEIDKTGLAIRNLINDAFYEQNVCMFIFDGKNAKKPRRNIYPGYKVGRNPAPDFFYVTLGVFKEMLMHTNKVSVTVDGVEADDVIASLVRSNPEQSFKIFSNDADFRALCNDRVTMSDPKLTAVAATEIQLYKALKGDNSDKIPGLKNFGEKAWSELTPHHKEMFVELLEGTMTEFDFDKLELKPAPLEFLKANLELVRSFYKVVGFFPVSNDLINANMTIGNPNYPRVQALLKELFL